MKPRHSLRKAINLIFFIVWLIIFLAQIIYIYTLYIKSLNDAQTSFSNSMVMTSSILEEKLDIGTKLLETITNNKKLFEYFDNSNDADRAALWQELTEPIHSVYNITSEHFYALAFDASANFINADDIDPKLVDAAHTAYMNFKKNDERICFYSISDTPYANMFFFIFDDITLPSYNEVNLTKLGTTAVAGIINTYEIIRPAGLDKNTRITLHSSTNPENDVVLSPGLDDSDKFLWKQGLGSSTWFISGSTSVDTPISLSIILLATETLVMSILFLVIQQFVRRSIMEPLFEISDFLQHYSLLDKGKRIALKSKTEIGDVANKINEMVDEIERLSRHIVYTQQQLYEREIAHKNTSLYALQAQLNPHFMYNTLDCICGIANVSGVPEIADIAVALSKILRYNLSKNKTVSFLEEIDIAKKYLTIMQARQSDPFTAKFSIPDEVKELKCLKMLLQPIIENSFRHGFKNRPKDALITVSAIIIDDCLLVTVFDNGLGISQEKLYSIRHTLNTLNNSLSVWSEGSSHIGLINIQNRIRLNYGDKFGIHIESEENKFTRVILRLPIIKKGQYMDE